MHKIVYDIDFNIYPDVKVEDMYSNHKQLKKLLPNKLEDISKEEVITFCKNIPESIRYQFTVTEYDYEDYSPIYHDEHYDLLESYSLEIFWENLSEE